jgi:hypothetical protein
VLYPTGYVDRLFRHKGVLGNGEAFLEKPSSFEAILEAISVLLDDHSADVPLAGDAQTKR